MCRNVCSAEVLLSSMNRESGNKQSVCQGFSLASGFYQNEKPLSARYQLILTNSQPSPISIILDHESLDANPMVIHLTTSFLGHPQVL